MDIKIPPLMNDLANPVVQVLEKLLADVRAGSVSSVGLIAITPAGQVGAMYAGQQRADIYVGADLLKTRMLDEMRTPPSQSPIIRARIAG